MGLRHQLETARRTVSKAGNALRPGKKTTASTKAILAATGMAAASAVGLAAVRMRKKRAGNGALHSVTTFHLDADGENGWVLSADGSGELEHYRSKRHAMREARRSASAARPSHLLVHSVDGRVQQTLSYGDPDTRIAG